MSARAFLVIGSVVRAHAAGHYVLNQSYVGRDFFEKWNFFVRPDPTHGFVDYLGHEAALEAGLIAASPDNVYMGADMRTRAGPRGRRSVRVESKATYNGGLFIVSLDHMPTGCGLWPAFWMMGGPESSWPRQGEFDIIEGVHMNDRVQATLHTTKGCNQWSVVAGRDFLGEWQSGTYAGSKARDCWVGAPNQWKNQGCAQKGPGGSMGQPFNAGGGGTFAAEWGPLSGHIRIWFWPRGLEPPDILDGRPKPLSWGKPFSFFRLTPGTCPREHFKDMRMIFDLTFCGDWADATFAWKCPIHAAQMSCRELVENHPEEMSAAYWSIRALDVYTFKLTPPFTRTATTTTTTALTSATVTPTTSTTSTATTTTTALYKADMLHQIMFQNLRDGHPEPRHHEVADPGKSWARMVQSAIVQRSGGLAAALAAVCTVGLLVCWRTRWRDAAPAVRTPQGASRDEPFFRPLEPERSTMSPPRYWGEFA